jgi:hypothetical protein
MAPDWLVGYWAVVVVALVGWVVGLVLHLRLATQRPLLDIAGWAAPVRR